MRSSKNRSRSKGNRNRSVGNIVNRVFDSSGPEGKVRGTPQQIIDKYNQLTRDAQLSNDRVAAENFQQHAEHYLRMLAEAQREQEARQQQHQAQQGAGQGRNEGDDRHQSADKQPRPDAEKRDEAPRAEAAQPEAGSRRGDRADRGARAEFDAVIDPSDAPETGLVETPESAPKPKRSRTRRPRKTDDKSTDAGDDNSAPDSPQEAAE